MPNESVALFHERHRHEVRVPEPLADLRSLGGRCMGSAELALHGLLDEGRDQEIAPLDALAILPLDQALPASEPSPGGRGLPEEEEVVSDPPRASGRVGRVARFTECVVGLLERAAVLVVEAEHVCRARQQLEVFWFERLVPVRARERFERLRPRPVRVGPATLLEGALCHHPRIFDDTLSGGERRRVPPP